MSRITATPDGCWEWGGKAIRSGYGLLHLGGNRYVVAHRFFYTEMVGPIPEDMDVCHTCDNPPCCNPKHLFLGTVRDNMLDMYAKGRRYPWGRKLTCLRGHPRTPENLYGSQCVTCRREYKREWRARRRESGLPA